MYQKYNNGEISALQSYIILISIMIGTGILGLSRVVSKVSQQDAWISVFLNGIAISIVMAIMIYTISKFPELNFVQYTSYLFSKPLGYIVSFSYILYSVLVTGVVVRFLSEMTYTWLLPNTPQYIINIIIIITAVYMIQNGLSALARFNEVIAFMLIPLALLVFVGLPEASLLNLRPVGGSGIVNIIKGMVPSFFSFAGFEVMLIYYPYISNKEKSIIKYSVLSVIVVTIFYTVTVASQIALFGHDELQHVLYPSINYLTSTDFTLVERMELFFTIFWTFTVLGTIGLQYLAPCILLQNIFNTKKTRNFVYVLSPAIYLISIYPKNTKEVVNFGDLVGRANAFFGFALPLLIFIMYLIRGRSLKNEKSS